MRNLPAQLLRLWRSDGPDAATTAAAQAVFGHFDAVLMLTHSNWHAEPGSNRHHYATRLAAYLPVFMVQPDLAERSHGIEPTGVPDITILHVGHVYGLAGALHFDAIVGQLGFTRPLLWCFNPQFVDFIELRRDLYSLYHATENYIANPDGVLGFSNSFTLPLKGMLRFADLVVSCAEGVTVDHRDLGPYDGPLLTIPNGCDFGLWNGIGKVATRPRPGARPVAMFQGGINRRIDFPLLERVIDLLPDWDWWFAGEAVPNLPEWDRIAARDNVKYLGALKLEEIPLYAKQATVGVIPYQNVPILVKSYPAKAFEFVSCGLPVVSSPIDALAEFPDLFQIADNAEDFAACVRAAGRERYDKTQIRHRLRAAEANSYDARFGDFIAGMTGLMSHDAPGQRPASFIAASLPEAVSVALLSRGAVPPVLAQLLGDWTGATLDPNSAGGTEFDLVIATTPEAAEAAASIKARARCLWLEEAPLSHDGDHDARRLLQVVDLLAMADVIVWTKEVEQVVSWRLCRPGSKPIVNLDAPSRTTIAALAPLAKALRQRATPRPEQLAVWDTERALLHSGSDRG